MKLSKVCLLDKRSWLMTSFSILITSKKVDFRFVNYTSVTRFSQWRHPSFHKRYPWYKFQVHTTSRSRDTREVTLIIVEKLFQYYRSCTLCLHEKFKILAYPNQNDLLNKRSELVSKCCHVNKNLLSNYKANDWHSI